MTKVIRTTREAYLERRLVDDAWTKLGLRSLKLTLWQTAGWPDRLFILGDGRTLWLEVKRPGEALRPLQEERHAYLRRLGHDVLTVDNYEAGWAALEERM